MGVKTSPNRVYVTRQQARRGCVEKAAWLTALKLAGVQAPSSDSVEARRLFNKVREFYWRERVRFAVAGEFNLYNLARMRAGRAPIGPDGFPMELEHREELNHNPSRALDPDNIWEIYRRQHDFQHGNYAFRWHGGSEPKSPHERALSVEFGNAQAHDYWP